MIRIESIWVFFQIAQFPVQCLIHPSSGINVHPMANLDEASSGMFVAQIRSPKRIFNLAIASHRAALNCNSATFSGTCVKFSDILNCKNVLLCIHCTVQGVSCLPNLEELYATSNRIQRVDCLAKCKKVYLLSSFHITSFQFNVNSVLYRS